MGFLFFFTSVKGIADLYTPLLIARVRDMIRKSEVKLVVVKNESEEIQVYHYIIDVASSKQ